MTWFPFRMILVLAFKKSNYTVGAHGVCPRARATCPYESQQRRNFRNQVLVLLMIAAVIGGCAAGAAMSDASTADSELAELAQQQQTELTSYAALLRVKMRHEGKIDDFRAEIFAGGDSLLSVYVRGFLGKSAFKALLRGDSLLVYFPSERKYFSGWRHDIETGELRDTRYIVDYLFALLQGYVALPDSSLWSNHIVEKGDKMQLVTDDRAQRCVLRVDLSIDRQKFPF